MLDNYINIESLTSDLNKIKDDSVLRLMGSKHNENKSNRVPYKKIKKLNDEYIGIILEDIEEEDNGNNRKLTIYQNLNEPTIRATSKKIGGRKIKLKTIIDLI